MSLTLVTGLGQAAAKQGQQRHQRLLSTSTAGRSFAELIVKRVHSPLAHEANGTVSLLVNSGTGLCITSLGTHTDGAFAEQWTCNSNSLNQLWDVEGAWFGGDYIWNIGDEMCLTNHQGLIADGNPQTMWPCDDSGNYDYKQSYFLGYPTGQLDVSNIYPYNSSDDPSHDCISSYGSHTVGSPILEYSCTKDSNQTWSGAALTYP